MDVEPSVRAHLRDCPLIRAELADERYAEIAKTSQQVIDTTHTHIADSLERVERTLKAGTCVACRNVIQPGQRQYRYPAGDYHVHCFAEERRSSGSSQRCSTENIRSTHFCPRPRPFPPSPRWIRLFRN